MKPSQAARVLGSHVLVYGEPKTGKSTLVYKLMQEGYKLWYFCLDGDFETKDKMGLSQEQLDNQLEYFPIPDTPDFPVAREVIRNVVKGIECLICDKHGQLGCGTCKREKWHFSRICLNEFTPKDILVIDHAGQLKTSTQATIARDRKESPEDYKMTQPDWGTMGLILDTIFSNIQQSRANIIVIAHTVETVGEDNSKKLTPEIGTGNFSRTASKYFGHVVYLEMKNASHKAGSATTYLNNVITGSRGDIAIEKMKEPSLAPFFDGRIKTVELKEHGSEVAKSILGAEKSETKPVEQKIEFVPEITSNCSTVLASKTTTLKQEIVSKTFAPEPDPAIIVGEGKPESLMLTQAPKLSMKERLALLNAGKKKP